MAAAIKRAAFVFALAFAFVLAVPSMALAEEAGGGDDAVVEEGYFAALDGEDVAVVEDEPEVLDGEEPAAIEEDDDMVAQAASSFTADEAIAWVKSKVGKSLDVDGSYGAQCVDLILAYYEHLGVNRVSGNAKDYATNKLPSGWTRVKGGTPQKGDILVYSGSSSNKYGHVAICESNKVTYHQNYKGARYVVKVTNVAYNKFGNTYWGYIRPNFKSPVPNGKEMTSGYARTIPDGDYAIVATSTLNSDTKYYLDIEGTEEVAANSTNVSIHGTTANPANIRKSDVWHVTYSDGFYTIKQYASSAALDVKGASLARGTNVQVYGNKGNKAQQWAISTSGSGYRIQSRCNGFSLDISGATMANGTNVRMWTGSDSDGQRWSFVPVSELLYGGDRPIPDGEYAIVFNTKKDDMWYYLDIAGTEVPAAEGANVQFYATTGDPAELPASDIWHVAYKDGYYTITQKDTDAALDVNGASLNQGANVQVNPSNNSKAQQWVISRSGNGYSIRARCNGYGLDVSDVVAKGSNVNVMADDGTNMILQWAFMPIAQKTPEPTAATYTVKFTDGQGKTLKTQKVEAGKAATAPAAPTRTGYTFDGWDESFSKVTSDLTVNAKWKANAAATYTVKFTDGQGRALKTQKVEAGKAATAPAAPTRSGYTFDGWDKPFSKVTSDLTVNAKWKANSSAKSVTWTRLAGDNAFKTMSAVIDAGKFAKGGTVVLASLEGYWDALTAAGIAGLEKAPVVMATPDGLSAEAKSQLEKLAPKKIVVCGGTYWLPQKVLDQARAAAGTSPGVVRLAGSNAAATAEKIAAEGAGRWSGTAIVATAGTFQDALAAAPVAWAKKMPIFLAQFDFAKEQGYITQSTIKAMKNAGVTKCYIAGGTYWIPKKVEDDLKAAGITVVKRLGGATAVETSGLIAQEAVSKLGMKANKMGVANVAQHYDALASASFCGQANSVLVLVRDDKSSVINGFVKSHKASMAYGYVFGGTGSVSAASMKALQAATS